MKAPRNCWPAKVALTCLSLKELSAFANPFNSEPRTICRTGHVVGTVGSRPVEEVENEVSVEVLVTISVAVATAVVEVSVAVVLVVLVDVVVVVVVDRNEVENTVLVKVALKGITEVLV